MRKLVIDILTISYYIRLKYRMSAHLSTPPADLALSGLPQPTPISGGFKPNSPRFDMNLLGMPALKSFAMLVGVGGRGYPATRSPELPKSGNCQDWKPPIDERCSREAPKVPEARYAYYRRCQRFRHNGEQCKAPAMKGEQICHRHAEQADNERRRQEQRRELLSRPGVGFGSFDAIQRTLSELAQSVFAGTIDHKVAGRLIVDILNAIRLQKMLELVKSRACRARARRPGACAKKPVPARLRQKASRRSGDRIIGSSGHPKTR